MTRSTYDSLQIWLKVALGLSVAACIAVGYFVVEPYLKAAPSEENAEFTVPGYDYESWHRQPVQVGGRVKPFETAAIEAMREITSREKYQDQDAVAVVLMWMLSRGEGRGEQFPDWEEDKFIFCDHHGLRRWIFAHTLDSAGDTVDEELVARAEEELSEQVQHGKFVSPKDLRTSPGFRQLLDEVMELRQKHNNKATQFMSPEQKKAQEVHGRLMEYTVLARPRNIASDDPTNRSFFTDPVKFVMLNRVPDSDWLSIGDIDDLVNPPEQAVTVVQRSRGIEAAQVTPDMVWKDLMLQLAMRENPVLYLEPEKLAALEEFQDRLRAGEGEAAIDELAALRKENAEAGLARFLRESLIAPTEAELLMKAVEQRGPDLIAELRDRVRVAQAEGYVAEDPKYKPLHLDYLEARYPFVYREAAVRQDFPAEAAGDVIQAWAALQEAYLSEDAEAFDSASAEFFGVIRRVSDETLIAEFSGRPSEVAQEAGEEYEAAVADAEDAEEKAAARDAFFVALEDGGLDVPRYPNSDTIGLELTFNKTKPFMWAWILMLPAVIAFSLSYMSGSKVFYYGGFALFGVSLAFQIFGFYARITISGRPPVSNMYETIIFVAFMSALFGMILELVYRKAVIAIAASMVSLIALVLADQLPNAFSPGIEPLVPVLRSNFWLIIHVLTITASYAGGALAWGLANVALVMLAFGTPKRETLKTLSTYTYRAMQIAVLLLAAGTFLGGWWAAYSWGRFWGWDPKETWALISLICYVIPLHMRYIGWLKDFGLAVAAVLCFAAILMCWYGVNFVLGAGLHSYGFGGGGPYWVLLAGLANVVWVSAASMIYLKKTVGAEYAAKQAAADAGQEEVG